MRAWWKEGFCHLHLPNLSFSEWLTKIIDGAKQEDLPGKIEIFPAVLIHAKWHDYDDGHMVHPGYEIKSWGQTIPNLEPQEGKTVWVEGTSQILLIMGSQDKYHNSAPSSPPFDDYSIKSIVSPEEATVVSDYLMELSTSIMIEKLSAHLQECIERSKLLDENLMREEKRYLPKVSLSENIRWRLKYW